MPKSSEKGKSVIVIVDSRKGESRSFHIPSIHLKNLKYYITGISAVFCALIVVCATLTFSIEKNKKKQEVLALKVDNLQEQIPTQIDSLNAQDYVLRIDEKISTIEKYLRERGIKGFSQEGMGGKEIEDLKLSPVEYYSMYYQYLERLFEGLSNTPTGFPSKVEMASNYGYRRNPFNGRTFEFHSGIDFRGNKGDKIRSTAGGTVVFSGSGAGYGLYVQVQHIDGYETLYGHLSKILVKEGDKIVAGQTVGEMGSTGRSTGNHLHYEVRKQGKPINPTTFLSME